MQSTNNLKQIGLGLHSAHDAMLAFPPLSAGWWASYPTSQGGGGYSQYVGPYAPPVRSSNVNYYDFTFYLCLMPYLEQGPIYTAGANNGAPNCYSTMTSASNVVLSQQPKFLVSPTDYSVAPTVQAAWSWVNGNSPVVAALTSYAPNYDVFALYPKQYIWNIWENTVAGATKISNVTDGLSNTIFIGEKLMLCGANAPSTSLAGNPNISAWGVDQNANATPWMAGITTTGGGNWSDNVTGFWEVPQPTPTPANCSYWRNQAFTAAGCQMLIGDGSVRNVSSSVSYQTFSAAITPSGGETLGTDW
jgi:hypothetical protein